MVSEIELLPCPFCGGEVYFSPDMSDGRFMIFCDTLACNVYMDGLYESEKEITDIWNTRSERGEDD